MSLLFLNRANEIKYLHQLDTGVWIMLSLVVVLSLALFLRKMVCGYVATELCLGYSEAVKYKYSSRRGLKIAKMLQKRGRGGGKHG